MLRLLGKPKDHRSILITDANADVRGRLLSMLEPEGFSVYEASACREAVEVVRRRMVDILICNMMLPDADGVSTLEMIRRTLAPQQPPPCIFIGRTLSKEMRMQAMMARAFAVVEEPFEKVVVKRTVLRLVYRHYGPPVWPTGNA